MSFITRTTKDKLKKQTRKSWINKTPEMKELVTTLEKEGLKEDDALVLKVTAFSAKTRKHFKNDPFKVATAFAMNLRKRFSAFEFRVIDRSELQIFNKGKE